MSQTPPQICFQCQTRLEPGQRFCSNCGAVAANGPPMPTAAATPMTSYPNSFPGMMPGGSNSYPPHPTPVPGFNAVGQAPVSQAAYTQYNTPPPTFPPPPPSDPYASGTNFTPPPAKKRSPWPFIIIGVVVLLILVCAGSSLAVMNALNPARSGSTLSALSPGSQYASSVNLNLTAIYASDQMTFTSIQQASKFQDDSETSYSLKPDYVRLNFKEQQTSNNSSIFSYTQTFHLLLPDKSVVAAGNTQNYGGPEQAVIRTNWVDFPMSARVDLSKLTLRLGASDEVQMNIPLQNGVDLSQYKPKSISPATKFQYATMNWTLQSVTQSFYFNGKQAKSDEVYVTVQLTVDNNTSNEVFLSNFLRLKSGATVTSPEYSSSSMNFDIIKPNTTNIQGSLTFLIPSANKYTLDFLGSSDNTFTGQTVDVQFS